MTGMPEYLAKTYLGDGVYARFDGFFIWISLNGINTAGEIALDPQVFDALKNYRNKIGNYVNEAP